MDKKIERVLPLVQKPGRYTGGEYGEIKKDPAQTDLRMALCFPDVYEIGMSNTGMRILYQVLNDIPGVWCERAFAPWFDMREQMREKGIPLYALESGDPLADFDAVGFSLSYEMAYTTVLEMLSLAGIPLRRADRESLTPLIFAGGSVCCNSEPMAPFFDLMIVGEGESVDAELLLLLRTAKQEGWTKREFLAKAARIGGVYVPSLYVPEYAPDGTLAAMRAADGAPAVVTKRIVEDFENSCFPVDAIVPNTEIVHDRVGLELFRGCIRGCRFCQAGHIYRPVRSRSVDRLLAQGKEALAFSGYQEITLLSLSTSDYRGLTDLCDGLMDYCEPRGIGLSLPSLRADNFSMDIMQRVQKVRKSGLTFAPEAGTQRLRDVINKNVTEEELLRSCATAFRGGWNGIKLYFMLGLPTETDEDVIGIAELADRVVHCWRENAVNKARGLRVTVSTSCFVPKPHTPFQRCGMVDRDELERRVAVARDNLRGKNIFLSWHDPACSRIEAAVARGDRKVGEAVYNAWRKGAKLEQENFVEQRWIEAFAEAGITIEEYANREIAVDETLPWGFIDSGVSRAYLEREYEKALREETTTDCRRGGCTGCGLREKGTNCPPKPDDSVPERPTAAKKAEPKMRVSVLFKMAKSAKWIGHLDLLGVMERAVRMAKIDAVYTEGFNPRIKMSLASALPLGASSDCELFTLVVNAGAGFDANKLAESLNKALPRGVRLREPIVRTEHAKAPVITGSEYEITVTAPSFEGLDEAVKDFMAAESFETLRKSGGKKPDKNIDARKGVAALTAKLSADAPEAVVTANLIHMEYTVKPSEIAEILARRVKDLRIVDIHRSKLTAKL
jgi:radical SAM family uncharacterized protein/radical SAM-linked protein